ncbi:MAG: alpha/beta fold hydrolase [Phycisphaerales bacterium]|nr:alpha/beta fold hydrolase [Phycisphaerales bacterium]
MQATVSGIRLSYEVFGQGSPLLFIHGFPLSGAMWHEVAGSLPGGWRGIVPDLRGHGQSEATPQVTIGQFADDLAGLLDAMSERAPAVVCGLSMGGIIAMEFYRRYTDRVRALVLCDTRANAETPEGIARREHMAQTALREGTARVVDIMIANLFAPSFPAERRSQWRALMSATPAVGVAAAARALAGRPDSIPTLPEIRVPTLVICGEEDAISPPEMMRAMHALIPDSRFVLISGAGHVPPVEQPNAFAAALGTFLASLPPTAAAPGRA